MFLNSLEEEAWYHRWSFLNKDCVILAQQRPFLYQTATPPQCVTLRTHKQKRHCVNRLSVGQCFIKIATVIYCICYMALGFVLTPHRPPSFADIFSCCSSLTLAANCCELPLFCLFVCLFVFQISRLWVAHTTRHQNITSPSGPAEFPPRLTLTSQSQNNNESPSCLCASDPEWKADGRCRKQSLLWTGCDKEVTDCFNPAGERVPVWSILHCSWSRTVMTSCFPVSHLFVITCMDISKLMNHCLLHVDAHWTYWPLQTAHVHIVLARSSLYQLLN